MIDFRRGDLVGWDGTDGLGLRTGSRNKTKSEPASHWGTSKYLIVIGSVRVAFFCLEVVFFMSSLIDNG